MRNYWMHRIASATPVSYELADLGWLTIGWQYLFDEGHADDPLAWANDPKGGLRHFIEWFKPGDIVAVPLMNRQDVGFYEILGDAVPVTQLPESVVEDIPSPCLMDGRGLYRLDDDGERVRYDIGYVRQVRHLKTMLRRDIAPRLRTTINGCRTINCGAVAESVEESLRYEKPTPLSARVRRALVKPVLEVIREHVTHDGLERLVAWLMGRMGANSVCIPAKNERGKRDGADADVVATFDDLNARIYVQVKKHEGMTDEHCVEQIMRYVEQKGDDEYTSAAWAVSTAEFSEGAQELARGKGITVRLLDGPALADLLIRYGFEGIDEVVA